MLFSCIACHRDGNNNTVSQENPTISATLAKQDKPSRKGPEITAEKLNSLRKSGTDLVILDVRTPKEVAAGKIPDAVEIDFHANNFRSQIASLPKDKVYVVYCKSGSRSGKTVEYMLQSGFQNVYNLKDGYEAWEKAQKKAR